MCCNSKVIAIFVNTDDHLLDKYGPVDLIGSIGFAKGDVLHSYFTDEKVRANLIKREKKETKSIRNS